MFRRFAAVAVATLALGLFADSAEAQQYWTDQPVIGNYNYYVQQPHAGGSPAEMYPAPRPTPGYVGHHYITYEPFAPHQFLNIHARIYSKNHGYWGGRTRTYAIWF